MRVPTRWTPILLLLALSVAVLAPASAHANGVRVLATDARGVTLELTVGAWSLSAPDGAGRVTVEGLAGAYALAEPGRPMLPAWAATLALPPGSRPSARVIASGAEDARDAVRPVIAGRPAFRDDPSGRLGAQPIREDVPAIEDGPWPPSPISLDAPFAFRGRRLVHLEFRPFRHEPGSGRLVAPRTLTVRVDFNRPAGAAAQVATTSEPDPHADAVLEGSVVNWTQGRGWRVPPAPLTERGSRVGAAPAGAAAANAFDESFPEVRVRLDESALHRLPYEQLTPHGFPVGVPVGEVSVHRHEYVANASPPFVTIELPCEVEDANANGLFDAGDGIWLWARKWSERTNATNIRRWWGDSEVVYVTRKPSGGLRVPQRSGWNGLAGLTPPTSFPFTKHFERDSAPMMQFVISVGDTNIGLWQWTDASSYYNRPDTIRVDTQGLDTTRTASLTVRFVGRKFDTHVMWAAIRNGTNRVTTVVDSLFWFGKSANTRTVSFPGSVLTEGATNFLRLWGKNDLSPPDPVNNAVVFAGLDWFDLTYWRRYRAESSYLRFNSGTQATDFQLRVDGFDSDSIRVYDVTDPDRPVRLVLPADRVRLGTAGYEFDLQDVVTGPRREYVAAAQIAPFEPGFGPRVPPASAYSRVVRRDLWNAPQADHLIVFPEAFGSAVPLLAALRRSQGLSVLEAPVESIYDEFGDGRKGGVAIERFVEYAYRRWNSRFLLLVGDGSLDPNGNRRNSGRDWIPALPTPGPVGAGEGLEITVSDNRYAFVTGNEDPISSPDSNRVVPELMVGRLTVNSLAEAQNVVSKIVAYEDHAGDEEWRKRVLLSSDDAFSGETTFGGGGSTSGYCHRSYEELFVDLAETMRGYIQSDSGVAGLDVDVFNLRSYLQIDNITFDGLGDTCRVSRDEARQKCHASVTPQLLGKLNAGQLLWNYQGHANEFVLTHEDLWINSGNGPGDDATRLANDGKPFLFAAFSCHANMFARPEHQLNAAVGPCLGEDLLAQPNGRGAIGSWASSCYEVVPRNGRDHINVELVRSMFVNPPRDLSLGPEDRGSRVILGEVVLAALFRYLGTVQSYAPERGLATTYVLLGDPATRLSIGRPLQSLTANGVPVPDASPVRLHTPGDSVRIEADVVTTVRLDSLALHVDRGVGAEAVTGWTSTPAFPDTAAGSVSGGRRFRLAYTAPLEARTTEYTVTARDRDGLVRRSTLRLQLDAVLRSGGTPIADGDEVPPSAALSVLLLSPKPLVSPASLVTLTLNGQPIVITATPVASDTTASGVHSGREWVLTWPSAAYPVDDYELVVSIAGGGTVTRRFQVGESAGRLAFRDLIPFPNPFDASGTHFSFLLLGAEPADVRLSVYTLSGRLILTRTERTLVPGYHQIAWDGRDAEGDELANGVYLFRMNARTAGGESITETGRLVKLRRPRRVEEPLVP